MNNRKFKSPRSSDSESSPSDSSSRIIHYIRAGYPALYIVTPEEQRVEAEFKAIAENVTFDLWFWSCVDGLVNSGNGQQNNVLDPLEALEAISQLKEKTIVLLKDFHLFLTDPNPMLVRKFKDVLTHAKTQNKVLIVLGCRLCLPPELEREVTIIEFMLPTKEELEVVLDGVLESANKTVDAPDHREKALNASKGLTTIEAENAFALSIVESGGVSPEIITREKAAAVKKNGLLEIIETNESLDSIGGLDVLKEWLLKRRNAFSDAATTYGLPAPRGLFIMGIAGTGKSLTAKATAKVFGLPLLKLDAGRIFAGLVGQSESNLRAVIQTAEAIAPCCLWIDEIDKAFAGSKSSGSTDGGTSARVFGSFISWMQEKTSPVFVVATANDVSQLPPELLRKGRWDEMFFVDLPNDQERESVWAIQIQKHGRNPKEYDTRSLSRATEGWTGSEIEAAFVETLYVGFDNDREPTDLDIAEILTSSVPLSKLMAEQINGLRQWAKGRARLATSANLDQRKLRRLAA